jgi:4-amino-4-deoxy-L-arabinose transferase
MLFTLRHLIDKGIFINNRGWLLMILTELASKTFYRVDNMRQCSGKLTEAGLLIFFLLFYVLLLSHRPLLIPDETRYAEIPREMLATGDWVVPHLDGLRYFEKPPLGYWLVAGSIALFGENNFAVRLPGTLAVGLTAVLVFLLTLKITGIRHVAALASLIYLTFIEVYAVGVTNVLDNFITLFITAGIACIYLAVNAARRIRKSNILWCLSGVFLGLAFLTKGFLAFVIPALVLVPWLLWEGQWKLMATKAWLSVFAAMLTIMPWAVLIHLREGDFWHYFFWVEHVERFTSGEGQHKWPFYYFLMYLPGLAFPWFNLAPAVIAGLSKQGEQQRQRSGSRLLWLWVLLPFIFFSSSSGKLATYILPCFPPLSVLMATGLSHYLHGDQRKLFNFGTLFNALILLTLFAVLLISRNFDTGFRAFDATEGSRVVIAALALLLGFACGLLAFLSTRTTVKLAAVMMTVIPLMLSAHYVIPNQVREEMMPGEFLEQYRNKIADDAIIIAEGSIIRAVTWYLKRDDVFLIKKKELAYGLEYPDASHRFLDTERFRKLLEDNAGQRDILLVCKSVCEHKVDSQLQSSAIRHTYGTFSLWYVPGSEKQIN